MSSQKVISKVVEGNTVAIFIGMEGHFVATWNGTYNYTGKGALPLNFKRGLGMSEDKALKEFYNK